MTTYVQAGKSWLNTQQIRAVHVEEQTDGTLLCRVEFTEDHVMTFTGDDAKAITGFLKYHHTTHQGPTTMPQ